MSKVSHKRERLVDAARNLFHAKGFNCTSLADIAEDSGVPLGNVYYYFKTKEELAESVIAGYAAMMQKVAAAVIDLPDPRDRLIGMLEMVSQDEDEIASKGCPMGSLCMEFGKMTSSLGSKAAGLLTRMTDFFEGQLTEIGRKDARELALHMTSVIQGASLLSLAMGQKGIFVAEMIRLQGLIRDLD